MWRSLEQSKNEARVMIRTRCFLYSTRPYLAFSSERHEHGNLANDRELQTSISAAAMFADPPMLQDPSCSVVHLLGHLFLSTALRYYKDEVFFVSSQPCFCPACGARPRFQRSCTNEYLCRTRHIRHHTQTHECTIERRAEEASIKHQS